MAIVLPKSKEKETALFQLSVLLNLSLFIVLLPVLGLLNEEIASLLKKDDISVLLPVIPILVLLSGFWQSLNFLFIRHNRYYNISSNNLTQSIISAASKCLLGVKGFLQTGLVNGQLIGQLFALSVNLFAGRKSLKSVRKINWTVIKQVAKEYSNFPKFELPHGLLNAFAANLPVLLLSFYFDMETIGFFSMAMTLGFRPVTLFSNSVYQVLYKKMTEKIQRNESIRKECILFCKYCVLFGLPLFTGLAFLPDSFFVVLLGEKWAGVGFYLKIQLPSFFISMIVASLSFIPDIFFKQKISMNIEIIYVIAKTLSLLAGVFYKDFTLSVILYSFVVVVMNLVKLCWFFSIIKKHESDPVNNNIV